jgi:hypothetical protein
MIDGVTSGELELPPAEAPPERADPRVAALEERVRRLEDLVAVMQEARATPPPAESVTAQMDPGRPNGLRESANLVLDAGRTLLPAAVGVLQAGAAAAEAQARAQAASPSPQKRSWLLFDLLADARAMLRMYFDPRYSLGWRGRLLPLVLLGAIVTSWLWLPGTAVLDGVSGALATLYMKAVDLILTFVLFKVVHREVRRYRETSPDLPPSLRL